MRQVVPKSEELSAGRRRRCTNTHDGATVSDALTPLERHPPRATFAQRAALLEELERMAPPQQRAETLQQHLEAANERVVARLRARIRAGRYTPAGLARAFAKLAEHDLTRDYDALDLLVAMLLDRGEVPPEQVALEPEMVRYQPTPAKLILAFLERAQVGPSDVVVDLGSGLGWVAIVSALLRGARARGVELEPVYCAYAERCAEHLNLRGVQFIQADARSADLAGGTVYFMYTPFRGALLAEVLGRLRLLAASQALRLCTYGPCTAEVARSCASWLAPRTPDLSEHDVVVFDPRT